MSVAAALVRLTIAVFALVGTREIWQWGEVDGLVYFTNQSNLTLAVVMVWGAVAQLVPRVVGPPAWLVGAVVLFLGITALVSHFVLDPEDPGADRSFLGLTSGQIEHQFTPLMALLAWVLLDRHRRLRWSTAALWLLYLVAYVVFTTIRGELLAVPDYPYGFVDLADLGWGGLLTNVAMYGVGFYVLGLVVVGIDKALPARALVAGRRDLDAPGSPGDATTPPARPTATPA